MGLANPGFWWFYFINEHVLRYLNRRVPRDYDTVPLLLFWGLLVLWLAPWIAFLRLRVRDKGYALLVLWAASVMVFFSFSTRQEYYSLPALPPLALLIGGWMAEEEKRPGRRLAVLLFVLGMSGGLDRCVSCLARAAARSRGGHFYSADAKPW